MLVDYDTPPGPAVRADLATAHNMLDDNGPIGPAVWAE